MNSIAEKLVKIAENEPKVYEAGRKKEYDVFWDAFQDYGNRYNYTQAFAYTWSDDIFKPKYDIKIGGDYTSTQVFFNSNICDLVECLNKANVKIDTSEAKSLASLFDRAQKLINTPPIDAIKCKTLMMTFYNSPNLKNINISNIQEDCVFDRTFAYSPALTDITLTNCTIGQNGFNVQWSKNLSADSLKSIIGALSTTTTGLTITLPNTAQNNYEAVYGSGSWATLTATRSNWTIAYA